MKDKQLIEKLLREEDNSLILNKLHIHEELKNFFIDKQICGMAKIVKSNKRRMSISSIQNNKANKVSYSIFSSINKHTKISPNSSLILTDFNDLNKQPNLNFDLNDDKYNLISNSPISTPTIRKVNINTSGNKISAKISYPVKRSGSVEYNDFDINVDNKFQSITTEIENSNNGTRLYIDMGSDVRKSVPSQKCNKSRLKPTNNVTPTNYNRSPASTYMSSPSKLSVKKTTINKLSKI
jgi:hypothetical protein